MVDTKHILFTALAAMMATTFIAIVPVLFGTAGHGLEYLAYCCRRSRCHEIEQ
jgi:hypothetical protein